MHYNAVGQRYISEVRVGQTVVFPLVDWNNMPDRQHFNISVHAFVCGAFKPAVQQKESDVDCFIIFKFQSRQGASENLTHVIIVLLCVALPYPQVVVAGVVNNFAFSFDKESNTFICGWNCLHVNGFAVCE